MEILKTILLIICFFVVIPLLMALAKLSGLSEFLIKELNNIANQDEEKNKLNVETDD